MRHSRSNWDNMPAIRSQKYCCLPGRDFWFPRTGGWPLGIVTSSLSLKNNTAIHSERGREGCGGCRSASTSWSDLLLIGWARLGWTRRQSTCGGTSACRAASKRLAVAATAASGTALCEGTCRCGHRAAAPRPELQLQTFGSYRRHPPGVPSRCELPHWGTAARHLRALAESDGVPAATVAIAAAAAAAATAAAAASEPSCVAEPGRSADIRHFLRIRRRVR